MWPWRGYHLLFQICSLLCCVESHGVRSGYLCWVISIALAFRSSWLAPVPAVVIVFPESLGLPVQPAAFSDLIMVNPCLLPEIMVILGSMLGWKIFCAIAGSQSPVGQHYNTSCVISLFSASHSSVKYAYLILLHQRHVLLVMLTGTNGGADVDFIWEFNVLGWGCRKEQIGKRPEWLDLRQAGEVVMISWEIISFSWTSDAYGCTPRKRSSSNSWDIDRRMGVGEIVITHGTKRILWLGMAKISVLAKFGTPVWAHYPDSQNVGNKPVTLSLRTGWK